MSGGINLPIICVWNRMWAEGPAHLPKGLTPNSPTSVAALILVSAISPPNLEADHC